jgi:hypothetical protein
MAGHGAQSLARGGWGCATLLLARLGTQPSLSGLAWLTGVFGCCPAAGCRFVVASNLLCYWMISSRADRTVRG